MAQLIKSLQLTNKQNQVMKKILDTTLNDVFYSILLALDGAASIGGTQESYDLKDEKSNPLSGELEGYAYDYFMESK